MIHYERPDKDNPDCTLEIEGAGPEVLRGLVQIVVCFETKFNINVQRFSEVLPSLVAVEKMTIDNIAAVDCTPIRRAKEGGGHE